MDDEPEAVDDFMRAHSGKRRRPFDDDDYGRPIAGGRKFQGSEKNDPTNYSRVSAITRAYFKKREKAASANSDKMGGL